MTQGKQPPQGDFLSDSWEDLPSASGTPPKPVEAARAQLRPPQTQAKPAPSLELIPFERDAGEGRIVPKEKLQALVAWAERYGLDPYASQVCLMFGQPYITEKGCLALAHKDTRYKGYTLNKLSEEKLIELGCEAGDWGWECSVNIEGFPAYIWDYGVVTHQELKSLEERVTNNLKEIPQLRNAPEPVLERERNLRLSYIPVYNHPGRQAKARAIRAAHLRAIPMKAKEEEK